MGIQRSALALAALAGIAASAVGIYSTSAFGAPQPVPPAPQVTAGTTQVAGGSPAGVPVGTPAKTPTAHPAKMAQWHVTGGLKDGSWADVASVKGQTWAAGSVVNPDGTSTAVVARWDAKKGWVQTKIEWAGNTTLTSIAVGPDGRIWAGGVTQIEVAEDTFQSAATMVWFEGGQWHAEILPFPPDFDATVSDVQVGPDGVPWVLGESDGHPTLMRRTADGDWKDFSTGLSGRVDGPMVVVGAREVYVPLSKGRIAHVNGAKTTMAQVFGDSGLVRIQGGAASGKNNVWFVGERRSPDGTRITPVAVKFDGTQWRRVTTPQVNGSFQAVALRGGVASMVGYTVKPGDTDTMKPLVAEFFEGRVRVSDAPKVNGLLEGAAYDGKRLWVVGLSRTEGGTTAYRQ